MYILLWVCAIHLIMGLCIPCTFYYGFVFATHYGIWAALCVWLGYCCLVCFLQAWMLDITWGAVSPSFGLWTSSGHVDGFTPSLPLIFQLPMSSIPSASQGLHQNTHNRFWTSDTEHCVGQVTLNIVFDKSHWTLCRTSHTEHRDDHWAAALEAAPLDIMIVTDPRESRTGLTYRLKYAALALAHLLNCFEM